MAKNKANEYQLWAGIREPDFNQEDDVLDVSVEEYDREAMINYSQNVNLMRNLPRLADSLKPVERRGLLILREHKSFPGTKPKKSSVIVGDVMTLHPHGDGSIYGTLVGLAQPFTNPIPLVQGTGNFGNDAYKDGYAAMRYTEMTMSKYAQDCFFSDYDDDCIEKIFNTSKDEEEPLSLPCKYPNILVNGGFGLAWGNAFCIPTYNVRDIVKLTKRLLHNPDADDIYILPDIPTGCDVIDDGSLREICDTGTGKLHMRATITVEDNPKRPNVWILRVHNLPWMVDLNSINNALSEKTKAGILPIKDIEDHSYPVKIPTPNGVMTTRKVIKYDIIINRALDPYQIIQKIYKSCQLDKVLSVNFKVVTDALKIDRLNMRDLILVWIDIRREYKRRLINKKISKLNARKSLLEILCRLTEGDTYLETMRIIRNNNASDAAEALMRNKKIPINSYQAEQIIRQGILMFAKDAHKKYSDELKEVKHQLEIQLKKVKDHNYIDEEIEAELEDLLKYASDRKSHIISEETNREIPNTDHFVVISKLGMVKKLPYLPEQMERRKTPSLGVFKNHDYPIHGLSANNLDSLMLFDNFGKYSCIPVHNIENMDTSNVGASIFDLTKMNGEIVTAETFFSDDLQRFTKEKLGLTAYILTLTKSGMIKKTPISEFTESRNQKNVKAMNIKTGDELIEGRILLEPEKTGQRVLIYTEKGMCTQINTNQIPEQSKNAGGVMTLKVDPDDACKGLCIIGNQDTHILVITEKGCAKLSELATLGEPKKKGVVTYITTLDVGDSVYYVETLNESTKPTVTVCTRTSYVNIPFEEIPVKARRAKPVKKIPVERGSRIIRVSFG